MNFTEWQCIWLDVFDWLLTHPAAGRRRATSSVQAEAAASILSGGKHETLGDIYMKDSFIKEGILTFEAEMQAKKI